MTLAESRRKPPAGLIIVPVSHYELVLALSSLRVAESFTEDLKKFGLKPHSGSCLGKRCCSLPGATPNCSLNLKALNFFMDGPTLGT